MTAAESGERRLERGAERARLMRAEADRLLAQAAAVERQGEAIAKGNEGERLVGALLDGLADEGWIVLHDRRKSARSPANLDHVLIGPVGVCVIDTKNWTGGRLRLDDRGMAVGSWRKDDVLHSAKVDADIVGRAVAAVAPSTRAVGVLAFVNDMGLSGAQLHQGVVVLQVDALLGWLRSLPHRLAPEQVQLLGACLEVDFPRRTSTPRAAAPASSHARLATARPVARAPARRPSSSAPSAKALRAQQKWRAQVIRTLPVLLVLLVLLLRPQVFEAVTRVAGEVFGRWLSGAVDHASQPRAG